MAFLSGKLPDDPEDGDEFLDIAEQPTEPTEHRRVIEAATEAAIQQAHAEAQAWIRQLEETKNSPAPRVCPVCVYYRESRGEHVEVGVAQLRLCADHMAATAEADYQTREVLRAQTRRAFNWYFWPHPNAPGAGGFGPEPGAAGDDWGGNDGDR